MARIMTKKRNKKKKNRFTRVGLQPFKIQGLLLCVRQSLVSLSLSLSLSSLSLSFSVTFLFSQLPTPYEAAKISIFSRCVPLAIFFSNYLLLYSGHFNSPATLATAPNAPSLSIKAASHSTAPFSFRHDPRPAFVNGWF